MRAAGRAVTVAGERPPPSVFRQRGATDRAVRGRTAAASTSGPVRAVARRQVDAHGDAGVARAALEMLGGEQPRPVEVRGHGEEREAVGKRRVLHAGGRQRRPGRRTGERRVGQRRLDALGHRQRAAVHAGEQDRSAPDGAVGAAAPVRQRRGVQATQAAVERHAGEHAAALAVPAQFGRPWGSQAARAQVVVGRGAGDGHGAVPGPGDPARGRTVVRGVLRNGRMQASLPQEDAGREQAVADVDGVAAGVAVPERRPVALADGQRLRGTVVDRARQAQLAAAYHGPGGAGGALVERVGRIVHGLPRQPGHPPDDGFADDRGREGERGGVAFGRRARGKVDAWNVEGRARSGACGRCRPLRARPGVRSACRRAPRGREAGCRRRRARRRGSTRCARTARGRRGCTGSSAGGAPARGRRRCGRGSRPWRGDARRRCRSRDRGRAGSRCSRARACGR